MFMLEDGLGGSFIEDVLESLDRPSKLTEKESREYIKGFMKKSKRKPKN